MTERDNTISEDYDDDIAGALTEDEAPVSSERAHRFYDRMRRSITRYLGAKGAEKASGWILLVPDVFMLMWRLVTDNRVSSKNKMLLGSGIAYYIFPFDIMPEGFLGPTGFVDDLVLGAYILNKLLTDTDPEVVRKHWSGSEELLPAIQRVLTMAESLVGNKVATRLKRMVG